MKYILPYNIYSIFYLTIFYLDKSELLYDINNGHMKWRI